MSYTVELVTKTKVTLDIDLAAKWFCGLSDEQQADFFIAVSAEAQNWQAGDQSFQWWLVGRHLKNCECSTDLAREMVINLHDGLYRP